MAGLKEKLKRVAWAEYWRMVGDRKWKLAQIWTLSKPLKKTGPFMENHKDSAFRAITPPGFAKSFYEANR